jgi:hypothetical protein
MRIRMYGQKSTFAVAKATEQINGYFLSEKADLENKMKRVARWEKRLAQLKDPKMLANVQELLTRFDELAIKHHVTWVESQDQWSSEIYAKYVKDDVTLDLYVDLNVSPDKLWANFYSRKHRAVALRIYIGKEVRVTDKILACILKGNS